MRFHKQDDRRLFTIAIVAGDRDKVLENIEYLLIRGANQDSMIQVETIRYRSRIVKLFKEYFAEITSPIDLVSPIDIATSIIMNVTLHINVLRNKLVKAIENCDLEQVQKYLGSEVYLFSYVLGRSYTPLAMAIELLFAEEDPLEEWTNTMFDIIDLLLKTGADPMKHNHYPKRILENKTLKELYRKYGYNLVNPVRSDRIEDSYEMFAPFYGPYQGDKMLIPPCSQKGTIGPIKFAERKFFTAPKEIIYSPSFEDFANSLADDSTNLPILSAASSSNPKDCFTLTNPTSSSKPTRLSYAASSFDQASSSEQTSLQDSTDPIYHPD